MEISTIYSNIACSLAATPLLNEKLGSTGFCVVDSALPLDILRNLAEEITLLDNILKVSPAKLLTSDDEYVMLSKPEVFELTIVQRSKLLIENVNLMSLIPTLKSMWETNKELTDVFKSSVPELNNITALDQIKVAVIKPGGCFPCHTDVQVGTGRVLSVTLYLDEEGEDIENPDDDNNCEYTDITDNGELRVYPYPRAFDEEVAPINILPTFGRMVLFSASNTYHRVLQSKREHRICLSIMFYGDEEVRPAADSGLEDEPASILFRMRHTLTPLIYFDEFCKSLREAFSENNSAEGGRNEASKTRNIQVDQAVECLTTRCRRALAVAPPAAGSSVEHHQQISSARMMLDMYASSCKAFEISKALV